MNTIHTICIVDDDEEIRSLLSDYLRRNGFSTCTAGNAAEFLEIQRRVPCSLIVMDIMLPGMDGFALLRQLREVNDAIPDPVMTAKISRLEDVSGRIFALAKKDPDKKAQLQKFMDYYLPTALKLLNTYAQLSAQDVQGTNITEAKQSIERSMDLLITAFENQLDKLFASDALDVSTDIAALEGMLNLDGLTGGDFAPRS